MIRARNRPLRLIIAVLFVVIAAYVAKVPLPQTNPTPSGSSATTPTSTSAWYPIVRVSDGDTIVIKKDGADVHVRLIGINTPEVNGPYTKEQCYGKAASAEAKKIMGVGSVRIETDPSQDLYDQYHRLLAYVYVPANIRPEGIMVNEYMVREGFAREYTYKKPYAHQAEFKADEVTAKSENKGLWAACPPAQAGTSS